MFGKVIERWTQKVAFWRWMMRRRVAQWKLLGADLKRMGKMIGRYCFEAFLSWPKEPEVSTWRPEDKGERKAAQLRQSSAPGTPKTGRLQR